MGNVKFAGFERIFTIRKMTPTKNHRPAVWEMLLGTLEAMNDVGVVKYFDYDYKAAMQYAGLSNDRDLRFAVNLPNTTYGTHQVPYGRHVLWIKKNEANGK